MAKICCVCGKQIAGLQRVVLQMKYPVCYDCIRAAGHIPGNWMGAMTTSPEELKTEIRVRNGYSDVASDPDAAISSYRAGTVHSVGDVFVVNEDQRCWYAVNARTFGGNEKSKVYSFDDVLEYELIEDGTTTIKGGIGSAVAGGLMFGGVGAVVGAAAGQKKVSSKCRSLQIKITLNNMEHPVEYIDLIHNNTVSKNSGYYKKRYRYAQEILSIMQIMTSQKSTPKSTHKTQPSSPLQQGAADEIRKFKELYDDGIITEEEFNAKKQQLLGL